jgi:hypothetical protein
VIDGFDLERAVRDPVPVRETRPCGIEHAMVVDTSRSDEMRGRSLHVGRQRPHVEIVHVDDPVDRREIGGQRVEVDLLGSGLDEDPDR